MKSQRTNDKVFYSRNQGRIVVNLLAVVISLGAINAALTFLDVFSHHLDAPTLAYHKFRLLLLVPVLFFVAFNTAAFASSLRADLGAADRPASTEWKLLGSPTTLQIVFMLDIVLITLAALMFGVLTLSVDKADLFTQESIDARKAWLLLELLALFSIWHFVRLLWHILTRGLFRPMLSHFTHCLLYGATAVWLYNSAVLGKYLIVPLQQQVNVVAILLCVFVITYYIAHGSFFIRRSMRQQDAMGLLED